MIKAEALPIVFFVAVLPAAAEDAKIDFKKTEKGAVVPLSARWSDVGSWTALYDLLPKDGSGNVVVGDALEAQRARQLARASAAPPRSP